MKNGPQVTTRMLTEPGCSAAFTIPDPQSSIAVGKDVLLPERLSNMATLLTGKTAIEYAGGSVSYQKLDALSSKFAWYLMGAGLKKSDHVFIYAARSPLLVVSIFAILKAGASFSLIDPKDPVPHVLTCASLAQPKLWLSLVQMPKALLNKLELQAKSDLWLGEICIKSFVDLDMLLLGDIPIRNFPVIAGDDTAVVTFTSGTSGKPKAVAGRHSSLAHFQTWMARVFQMSYRDRFAMCSNLSHDPIQRDIFTAIYLGGTVVIPSYEDIFSVGRLAEWMQRTDVTICCLTPPMCKFLTEYNINKVSLPALRRIFFVGANLLKQQVSELRKVAQMAQVINLYGSTETQRAVSYFTVPCDAEEFAELPDVVPIGQGMRDVDVLVVAKDDNTRLCKIGEVGEIVIRSPYISKGYLQINDGRFTQNPFSVDGQHDPVYFTGDMGFYDAKWGCCCVGRLDEQVKIDGHRVELSHIDNVLLHSKIIADCATVVQKLPFGNLKLVSFIVVKGSLHNKHNICDSISEYLQHHLPSYMVPRKLKLISEIPLTKNGKVDRRKLQELLEQSASKSSLDTSLQAQLYNKVASILNEPVDLASLHLPLQQLGLTSLGMMELGSYLQQKHSVEACKIMLNENLSIADIVAYITKGKSNSLSSSSLSGIDLSILEHEAVDDLTATTVSYAGRDYQHFCSNSYLGLASDSRMKAAYGSFAQSTSSIGSHGASIVNGHTLSHEKLINEITQLYHCDSAVLFSSAYLANISIIPALCNRVDHVIIDSACHRSIIDGCVLSGAQIYPFNHNDMQHLEQRLASLEGTPGRRVIISQGVFSMQGDLLDLPTIRRLATEYSALLVVDEASSLGLLGKDGAGIESHYAMPGSIDVRVGTLSKAIPSMGGYIALNDEILHKCHFQRGAVFSSAIPQLQAEIAAEAFQLLRKDVSLVQALKRNTKIWRQGLIDLGLNVIPGETAIVPIRTSGDAETKLLYQKFLQAGIYVFPAIYPWNKKGQSVIRTTVTAAHSVTEIKAALANLGGALICQQIA